MRQVRAGSVVHVAAREGSPKVKDAPRHIQGARERAQPHTHARGVFVFISLNQTGGYKARWD